MKKILSLLLIACILFVLPAASADDRPSSTVEAFAKNAMSGSPIFFTADDFLSRVNGAERLDGIIITSLPENGVLRYDRHNMLVGEAVTTENLNNLQFIPGMAVGVTGFSFLPVFSSGVAARSVEVGLSILEQANRPPVAEDVTIQTYKNVAITGKFNATDPDGDPLGYRITGSAKRGEFKIEPDGSFVYKPYKDKTGSDTVSYIAVDPYGNTSSPAKLTVKINKPGTKITYSDMEDNPAYFAAMQMAERNLLVGETIGGKHYFRPEAPVSRAEFLAIMVNALKLGEIQDGVRTGFADDDQIPAWARPYVHFGLTSSIIRGIQQLDGRRVFSADAPITRSQASVMLNKGLQISNSGMVSVFVTNTQTPSWAVQAVANLRSVGMLDAAEMFVLDQPMTRADVVVMLNNAVDLKEQRNEKKGGLLSWVFG